MISEKVAALTDRARNEPRDLYDIWYLIDQEQMDLAAIFPEIIDKLDFRGRSLEGVGDELSKKETRLKKLWDIRLANQMAELAKNVVEHSVTVPGVQAKLLMSIFPVDSLGM